MKGRTAMSTDLTEYPRPLEPTQAVHYNPYEQTSPYDDIPIPPPPPPKHGRKGLLMVVISIVCLVVLFGGVIFALMQFRSQESSVNATPASRATSTSVATPIPTPTPTATAITRVYDAMAIMQDLQQAGLQASNIQYGIPACSNKIAGLQSEACFRNVALCNLQCDEDMVWLQVFDTPQDAQLDYQQWVQSGGPVPSVILSGHCVVAGNGMNGTYAKIVAYDCQ